MDFITGVVWSSLPITRIHPQVAAESKIQCFPVTLHNRRWVDNCQVRHGLFKAILILDSEDVEKGYSHTASSYLVLATVPDRHSGSGSGSEPNRCQIGGPGYQHTRTVNSGTVRCKSPNPCGLGGLSAGRPAGPSVDLYNVLIFAVG